MEENAFSRSGEKSRLGKSLSVESFPVLLWRGSTWCGSGEKRIVNESRKNVNPLAGARCLRESLEIFISIATYWSGKFEKHLKQYKPNLLQNDTYLFKYKHLIMILWRAPANRLQYVKGVLKLSSDNRSEFSCASLAFLKARNLLHSFVPVVNVCEGMNVVTKVLVRS